MVDFGLVSLVELGALVVGIPIAVFEIRNMSQTRKAEVSMQFFNRYTTTEFWELWRHVILDTELNIRCESCP